MTPQVTSPPFQLDIRVAESPLVGIRFLLDGRASDLDQMSVQLDAFIRDVVAERASVRGRLRRNEEARSAILSNLAAQTPREVELCFAEGTMLCAELGAVEERIAGLRLRIDGLHSEAASLRNLSDALAVVHSDTPLGYDEDATRYSRAVRQLHLWVDDDQDRLVQTVTAGPLQMLADAAVSVELVGRLVAEGSSTAAAEELDRCRAAVKSAKDDVANVIDELRPPHAAGGLIRSMRELARGLPDDMGRFTLIGEDRPMSVSLELAIYRIAQEAVTNAMRHGHAERIDVVLSLHRERVVVVVRDDGDGFDAIATEARLGKTSSYGLMAMRQRAALEGGSLEVRSMVGTGTDVRASFRVISA